MSRESDLRISFPVSEDEKVLADQLAGALNELFSIDEITTDENGLFISVWNSEHYYLAEVTPSIMRYVAAVFPDRNIEASGSGNETVSDDVHEYASSYDNDSKLIISSWNNDPTGSYKRDRNRRIWLYTKYCVIESGLPDSKIKEVYKVAESKGFIQLIETLKKNTSDLPLQTDNGKVAWFDKKEEAIVACLRGNRELHVPDALQCVYYEAFKDCSRIETVSFGEAVQCIEENAFKNCKSIREVTLPKNIKELGNGIFANCSSLEKVVIECDLDSLPGSLFSNCLSLREVIITGVIKHITKTFKGLTSLETVVLPEGLESLGAEAFAGCSSLEKINLPNSLKKIAENAFAGCTKLKLDMPSGIEEGNAFEVQDDAIIHAVLCTKTDKEAIKLFDFLCGIGAFKQYQKEQDKGRDPFNKYRNKSANACAKADTPEKAKEFIDKSFTEKEVQKINLALKAAAMIHSGYKTKDVVATLGISSAQMAKVNLYVQWGLEKDLENVLTRLKGIIL